jgi:hypothetical protein
MIFLGNSIDQLNQARFAGEIFDEWFIESCQAQSMLARKRYKITISNLICSIHKIGPDNAIGATQIIGHELMA